MERGGPTSSRPPGAGGCLARAMGREAGTGSGAASGRLAGRRVAVRPGEHAALEERVHAEHLGGQVLLVHQQRHLHALRLRAPTASRAEQPLSQPSERTPAVRSRWQRGCRTSSLVSRPSSCSCCSPSSLAVMPRSITSPRTLRGISAWVGAPIICFFRRCAWSIASFHSSGSCTRAAPRGPPAWRQRLLHACVSTRAYPQEGGLHTPDVGRVAHAPSAGCLHDHLLEAADAQAAVVLHGDVCDVFQAHGALGLAQHASRRRRLRKLHGLVGQLEVSPPVH
eukprot:scaffold701_cov351-Prasinococcus_capsulatus_cf.AAC.2